MSTLKLIIGTITNFPIGHICKCGKEHKWPAYVYAHFSEEIEHACDCGIKSTIRNGKITLLKDKSNGA